MCANSREENEVYYSFSIHQLYKHEQYAVDVGITYTLSLFVKIGATTMHIIIIIIIIINIQGWSIWPVSSPELQLLSSSFKRYNIYIYIYTHTHTHIDRVSQEESARLRENVPYVKIYRYNPTVTEIMAREV
jgi:hypothetical protein